MKLKKWHWLLIVLAVLVVGWLFLRFVIGGDEDSWIKNEKGEYVEHGKPAVMPDYVKEQQDAVLCAFELYQQAKQEGMDFSSQCLGTCGNYVVDIVHVPRGEENNKAENQCEDYRSGKASRFIELDSEGNIFRIV